MVLLNVYLLTNRKVITYREVTVSVNKQTLWLKRPAEPVMVLNKLYDLSNAIENIGLSRMLNRSDSTYHISLNFFVILICYSLRSGKLN